MAFGVMPCLCLLLALASNAWRLDFLPAGGRSGDGTLNKLASPSVLEVWPPFLSSFSCHQGDGSSGRGRWGLHLSRSGLSSSSVASAADPWRLLQLLSYCGWSSRDRWPDSSPPNPLTEWRSYEEFLPARRWLEGRQPKSMAASMSSASSRSRRRWRGSSITPSGLVPGSDGVGSAMEMVQGPDCVFSFAVRVLLVIPRDQFVFSTFLCPSGIICNLRSYLME